jgi:hypothetical protein
VGARKLELLDHFVGEDTDGGRYLEAKSLYGSRVNHKLEQLWFLKRQVLWLRPFEDAINESGHPVEAS